nr:ribonuclease H-like domain-containing protein [Tanacetum cinerariifolium]GEZ17651.1 ribonuclease H-like domain-containing protein [Tanacetum cinerariifolium]GEZ17667.1 ribonuclease H-like domain-containing protein [Tanacetum cinerariifolium]
MDDTRDIWNAVKARFDGNVESKKMRKSMLKQEFLEFRIGEVEGLHKGYDRMHKVLSQLNQLKAKPKDEDINLKFLRALPSSWSQVALTLKTKGPSHSAFVSATSASKKISYGDSLSYSSTTTYSILSNSKTGSHISGNVIKDVLQSFVADTKPGQQLAYEGFEQIEKLDLEEMDLKWLCFLINADVETAKKDLQIKLDNHFVQTEKWRNSSKNLFRLIDSSMSIRTKVGLGFNNCIKDNELGWNDSAFSVFTTNSEDMKGRPLFHSDKSSEVNTNDFASSDFSVKSSEPKPNDFTSRASTSSVSTYKNEVDIESNVGTPIQEPIIVHDLPSFSCNSSDKNKNTFRTSCNKNGYFNKKACHFRNHASSVSKLCFVCGSGTHLIKDRDFYETQMANKIVGIGVGPVHYRNKVNHQNQFVPQAVLLRTGKENPFSDAEVEGIFDSGCSRIMTGNKERLDDFQVIQGGKVTFEGGEGRITGKGSIRTPTLDFENVYYVKELQQFNLFSIS